MHKLKFGCQSYPWKMGKHFGDLPRMLAVAKKAGFQSLEAEIDMLGDWFDRPEEVTEKLAENEMEFAALVLHQDWNGPGEAPEEKALSDKAISFVDHFPHAKIVLSHHAGNIPRGSGDALQERRKCLVGCMAEVAARAAENGIVCGFHPNSAKNSLFRTAEDYEEMFELLLPTAIGWVPDVGHIVNGGMNALEQLQAHRSLIRHVHFKDRVGQDEWALMGKGSIDYPEILAYLARTEFQGWIMVEDESPEAAADSDGVVAADGAYMCGQIYK